METPQKSDEGYPEEQPEEVAPDSGGASQEDRERSGQGGSEATESGDGTATGNPDAAGEPGGEADPSRLQGGL